MNIIEVLSGARAVEVLLRVGDSPDSTARQVMTTRSGDKTAVSAACRLRLAELVDADLVSWTMDRYCGRPVKRYRLTPTGEDVYRLLCVIRGMS